MGRKGYQNHLNLGVTHLLSGCTHLGEVYLTSHFISFPPVSRNSLRIFLSSGLNHSYKRTSIDPQRELHFVHTILVAKYSPAFIFHSRIGCGKAPSSGSQIPSKVKSSCPLSLNFMTRCPFFRANHPLPPSE